MKKAGLYILAGFMTIALTEPLCQADSPELILYTVNNNDNLTDQPAKDAGPRGEMDSAMTDVVVSQMTLLRSFFLMSSPESEGVGPEAPPPTTPSD